MKISSVCLYFSVGLFPVYGLTQTGPSPTSGSTSAEPTKTNSSQTPEAQRAPNSTADGQNASSAELSQVVVVGQLGTVRDEIVPSLGATKYAIGQTTPYFRVSNLEVRKAASAITYSQPNLFKA